MVKKFEDEEFKKFLEQEFIDETDKMEAALFSDEKFEEAEASDEEVRVSYARLVEKLKKDGVYREEKADGGKPDFEKAPVLAPSKRHWLAKAASFVLVCALGVFAAGMTSEANRNYFIESLRYLAGDDTRLVVDNDEGNELPGTDEYTAIEEIEKELGVEMPEFYYRPTGFAFYDYEVISQPGFAKMEYFYKDFIVTLSVRRHDAFQSSNSIELLGEEADKEVITLDDEVTVTLIEAQDKQDTSPTFAAQWQIEDTLYQVRGRLEKEELIKMIKNMKY